MAQVYGLENHALSPIIILDSARKNPASLANKQAASQAYPGTP